MSDHPIDMGHEDCEECEKAKRAEQFAWADPGHRLTEDELNEAEKLYNDFRRGRLGPDSSQRGALEAVIRKYLARYWSP